MHEVVSSSPIVMHIFHILLYWHILWYTGIYKYVLVWTCILVYELTHNVCTGMYAVVNSLVYTSLYRYILVCTCTYYFPWFGTMLWYMAVQDSGQVDVRSPPSLVPINPLSYRHIPAWIYLSGFVHLFGFLRESWCIQLCYCTYLDKPVCTVA